MIQHGVYLTWQNISAQINGKQILNNISGYCTPGNTLAIMGASGAGKTTLLSILAKKQSKGLNITGQILANQSPYTQAQYYNFASYVYQNDILNQALTVRQTLQFTAKLKIRNSEEVQHRVDQLINDLNLQKCQNTYVGGKIIKGISGGEKKRVCIAVEMVTKPDLLILDEPTSGLDSHMAYNMIKIFNKLAKKEGKTIVFTIHQPSYRIFSHYRVLVYFSHCQHCSSHDHLHYFGFIIQVMSQFQEQNEQDKFMKKSFKCFLQELLNKKLKLYFII